MKVKVWAFEQIMQWVFLMVKTAFPFLFSFYKLSNVSLDYSVPLIEEKKTITI